MSGGGGEGTRAPYPDGPAIRQAAYQTLLERERVLGPCRREAAAEYLEHRRLLVDWMVEVGEEYALQLATVHLAVWYTDRFLLATPFPKVRFQLVAMACVLLAAKFEENEGRVPKIRDLCFVANDAFSRDDVVAMERHVLRRLGWRLSAVTAEHFLRCFQVVGLVSASDAADGRPVCRMHLEYVQRYVSFFLELCLLDASFATRWKPSLVAASIVSASRRAVRVDPIWPPTLAAVTGYRAEDIYPCYRAIYDSFERTFPDKAKPAAGRPSPQAVADFYHEAAAGRAAASAAAAAAAAGRSPGPLDTPMAAAGGRAGAAAGPNPHRPLRFD